MEKNGEIFTKMPEFHEQLKIIAKVANERVNICSKNNEFDVKGSIAAMDDVYQAQIALIEAQRNHVKAFSAYLDKNPEYAAELLKAGSADISKSAVYVDNFVKKIAANKELLGKSVQQAWNNSSEIVKTGVEKFLGVTSKAFISGATSVAELGSKFIDSAEAVGQKINIFAKFVAAIPGKLMDHSIKKGIDIRDAGFEMAKKTVETTKEFVSDISDKMDAVGHSIEKKMDAVGDGIIDKMDLASDKIDKTLQSIDNSKAVIATGAVIDTGIGIGKSFFSGIKSFIDKTALDIKTAYDNNIILAENARGINSQKPLGCVTAADKLTSFDDLSKKLADFNVTDVRFPTNNKQQYTGEVVGESSLHFGLHAGRGVLIVIEKDVVNKAISVGDKLTLDFKDGRGTAEIKQEQDKSLSR